MRAPFAAAKPMDARHARSIRRCKADERRIRTSLVKIMPKMAAKASFCQVFIR